MIANSLAVIVFIVSLKVIAMYHIALPACNRWATWRSSADDAMETFDILSKFDIVTAKNYLKGVLEKRDKKSQEREQQFRDQLQDKEQLITFYQRSYLETKGLITSRGILERFLMYCSTELFGSVIYHEIIHRNEDNQQELLPTSVNYHKIIHRIEDNQQELPPTATNSRRLRTLIDECHTDYATCELEDLYYRLSSKIEGDSWDGEALKFFRQKLSTPNQRLITKIAGELGLI